MIETVEKWITESRFAPQEEEELRFAAQHIKSEDDEKLAVEVAKVLINDFHLKSSSVAAYFTRISSHDAPLQNSDSESIRQGLLRVKKLKIERVNINSENFRRLLITLCGDIRTLLILMAETLVILRNSSRYPDQTVTLMIRLARSVFLPFAHRLGLYNFKKEMEDLWMKLTHQEEYQAIRKMISGSEGLRNDFFRRFTSPLRKSLDENGFDYTLKQRYKSIPSIWRKMQNKQIDFNEIYDLFAIRVVLNSESDTEKLDCWKAYSIVSDHYPPDTTRLRDWISVPRPSGYESLHTTVNAGGGNWVEIQIRSQRMDDNAEKGSAAHWNYKEKGKMGSLDALLTTIRVQMEQPNHYDIEYGEMTLKQPYDDHIFTLTPNGDVHMFREGATVLDFAFDIHSKIGETCTGAKINSQFQSIRHKITSGDEIEIITSKNQKPVEDWLAIVNSSKAKAAIRRALRVQRANQSDEGRALLNRKLRNWKIIFDDTDIEELIKFFKQPNTPEFFHKIATQEINTQQIRDYFNSKEALKNSSSQPPSEQIYSYDITKRADFKDEVLILDQDAHNIDHVFASCCKPLPGDKVFGFVTVSKGIKIHRTTCPNAPDLRKNFAYRIIPVEWKTKQASKAYRTAIFLEGIDREGIVNDITKMMAQEKNIFLISISLNASTGTFEGKLVVQIETKSVISSLLKRLRQINGIHKAQTANL